MSLFNVLTIAGSALTAQSARLNATASNLANADSVVGADGKPYRAKQVVFKATPVTADGGLGVRVTQVVDSAAPGRMVYDPKSPAANEQGYVEMPNVNVVEEMVNMISASRAYQTNAEIMSTAKTLLLKTLAIASVTGSRHDHHSAQPAPTNSNQALINSVNGTKTVPAASTRPDVRDRRPVPEAADDAVEESGSAESDGQRASDLADGPDQHGERHREAQHDAANAAGGQPDTARRRRPRAWSAMRSWSPAMP